MISNQLSEVQPPDTVRAALSGIQKKRLAEGEGGLACENAWTWIVVETHGNFPALFFFSERHGLKHGRKFSV